MGVIGRFLGGYTDNFVMAVALWPLASLALTLPILAFLYHRDGRLKPTSVVSTYLAVLYLMGLGCFTLYPLPAGTSGLGITRGVPWQLDPLAFIGDLAREGFSAVPQIAFNVVLFVPLGFIAGRLFRWGFWGAFVAGLAVSLAIEAAQGTGLFGLYAFAYRTADVNDLMYNTLGAMAGWGCSALLARVLPPGALAEKDSVTRAPGFVRRCVAFWLDMLLAGAVTVVAVSFGYLAVANFPALEPLRDGAWPMYVALAVFVLVEGVIPWFRSGSTLGGGFVRMTFETRDRTGVRRFVFYAARLLVLGGSFALFPAAWPFLALFYVLFRRMPYDYL